METWMIIIFYAGILIGLIIICILACGTEPEQDGLADEPRNLQNSLNTSVTSVFHNNRDPPQSRCQQAFYSAIDERCSLMQTPGGEVEMGISKDVE